MLKKHNSTKTLFQKIEQADVTLIGSSRRLCSAKVSAK